MTLSKERLTNIAVSPGLEPCDYEETYSSITTGEIQAMARELLARREWADKVLAGQITTPVVPDVWTWEQAKTFVRSREIQFPVEAAHEAVIAWRASIFKQG